MVKREKKGGTRKEILKAQKRCNRCHEIKEMTVFYNDRSRSDGLSSKCKQCEYECRKLRYQKLKNRPANKIPHIESKRCSKCNEVKPVAEFYPALRNKDGYCDLCKSCSKKQAQSYHRRLAARIPQEIPRIKNKRCSKCGELKSISAFSKAVGKLDGNRAIGEKRCWMCKRLLPVEEFNYARSNYDGLANHCRECGIKYKRQHYEENYGNEYNRVKEYRRRYPERNRAFAVVFEATKKGDLIRPDTCSKCGKSGYIVAHHDDYSKPLNVVWLCLSCDRQLHADLRRERSAQSKEKSNW